MYKRQPPLQPCLLQGGVDRLQVNEVDVAFYIFFIWKDGHDKVLLMNLFFLGQLNENLFGDKPFTGAGFEQGMDDGTVLTG
jgi:hypothetical protein